MDGSAGNAGSGVTAVVTRQFAPSRIERQLLAQVFELVCSPPTAAEARFPTASLTASTAPANAITSQQDAGEPGRRAA